jgi:hypothetical protein
MGMHSPLLLSALVLNSGSAVGGAWVTSNIQAAGAAAAAALVGVFDGFAHARATSALVARQRRQAAVQQQAAAAHVVCRR